MIVGGANLEYRNQCSRRVDLAPRPEEVSGSYVGNGALLFSTRRVDFLSIKLGIRVYRDICVLSNRSSSLHDSPLASLPSVFSSFSRNARQLTIRIPVVNWEPSAG